MKLDRVTMTGADDSVRPEQLSEVSQDFPFVEWGILLSASSIGSPRFPSMNWLMALARVSHLSLSFHVCGRWVREICNGNWTPLFTNVGPVLELGRRVQLNFHSCLHLVIPGFVDAAKSRCQAHDWQLIFQCDGVNDYLVSNVYDDGLDAVPLYDKSGGAGILPGEWPIAMKGIYSGYAGGLGPDSLESELPAIATAAGEERFWIDMETKVRSSDDRAFNLDAVRRCLEICESKVMATR